MTSLLPDRASFSCMGQAHILPHHHLPSSHSPLHTREPLAKILREPPLTTGYRRAEGRAEKTTLNLREYVDYLYIYQVAFQLN